MEKVKCLFFFRPVIIASNHALVLRQTPLRILSNRRIFCYNGFDILRIVVESEDNHLVRPDKDLLIQT